MRNGENLAGVADRCLCQNKGSFLLFRGIDALVAALGFERNV